MSFRKFMNSSFALLHTNQAFEFDAHLRYKSFGLIRTSNDSKAVKVP